MTTPKLPEEVKTQEFTIEQCILEATLNIDNHMPTTFCLKCQEPDKGIDELSGFCADPKCQSWEVEYPADYTSWLVRETGRIHEHELALARQAGIEEGRKLERERLITTLRVWRRSHFPGFDPAWYIQNLLGDFLGWGTPEQEETSQLLIPPHTEKPPEGGQSD
jgi:hypothetical protein